MQKAPTADLPTGGVCVCVCGVLQAGCGGAALGRGLLHQLLAAGREILEIWLNVSVSSCVSDLQMGGDGLSEAVVSFGSEPFPSTCTSASDVSSARTLLQWAPKQLWVLHRTGVFVLGKLRTGLDA